MAIHFLGQLYSSPDRFAGHIRQYEVLHHVQHAILILSQVR